MERVDGVNSVPHGQVSTTQSFYLQFHERPVDECAWCLSSPFNPTVISLGARLRYTDSCVYGENLKCCGLCCICSRDAHGSAVSKAVEPACFTGTNRSLYQKLNPTAQEAYKRIVSSC